MNSCAISLYSFRALSDPIGHNHLMPRDVEPTPDPDPLVGELFVLRVRPRTDFVEDPWVQEAEKKHHFPRSRVLLHDRLDQEISGRDCALTVLFDKARLVSFEHSLFL